MATTHLGVARFNREGRLVTHGDADRFGRPDAVQFTGRAGQRLVDCAGELTVTIDRWGTRAGVGVLFEADDDGQWQPIASSMSFDAIYVTGEQAVRLVFSVWAPLLPGRIYRLHLAGAVITKPTVHIAAVLYDPSHFSNEKPTRPRRVAVHPVTAAAPAGAQQGALTW